MTEGDETTCREDMYTLTLSSTEMECFGRNVCAGRTLLSTLYVRQHDQRQKPNRWPCSCSDFTGPVSPSHGRGPTSTDGSHRVNANGTCHSLSTYPVAFTWRTDRTICNSSYVCVIRLHPLVALMSRAYDTDIDYKPKSPGETAQVLRSYGRRQKVSLTAPRLSDSTPYIRQMSLHETPLPVLVAPPGDH